jgi:hypothetical protein
VREGTDNHKRDGRFPSKKLSTPRAYCLLATGMTSTPFHRPQHLKLAREEAEAALAMGSEGGPTRVGCAARRSHLYIYVPREQRACAHGHSDKKAGTWMGTLGRKRKYLKSHEIYGDIAAGTCIGERRPGRGLPLPPRWSLVRSVVAGRWSNERRCLGAAGTANVISPSSRR